MTRLAPGLQRLSLSECQLATRGWSDSIQPGSKVAWLECHSPFSLGVDHRALSPPFGWEPTLVSRMHDAAEISA